MVAAVLVSSSSLHLAAGARVVKVQPSRGGVDLSRHGDPDIAGACALAVTPLGYPCEEHQVRFLYRVGSSSHSPAVTRGSSGAP
jgi:lysosomal acid lipase/cholesteryl ester hydrolase